jgi:hypothetical protein
LCIIDDLIQFGGSESQKYEPFFFPLMVRCLSHESPALRQAASYGIGLCAQYGASLYGPKIRALLPTLFALVQAPESRSEDNKFASENAISAIGKICQFASSGMESEIEDCLSAWIGLLPISGDEEEAPFVYLYVLRLLQEGWTGCARPGMKERMVSVLVKGVCCDVLDESEEEKKTIIEGLKKILEISGQEMTTAVWASLTAEEQIAIQKELSN